MERSRSEVKPQNEDCYLSQISEKAIVGAMIVGELIVASMIVGAMIVGAMIVGAMRLSRLERKKVFKWKTGRIQVNIKKRPSRRPLRIH